MLMLDAEPFDADFHRVATLQEQRWLHAKAYTWRGAGGDDVAGIKMHELRDIVHKELAVENHRLG